MTSLQKKFNNLETELRDTREEVKVLKGQTPLTFSSVLNGRSRREEVLTGSNIMQQVVGTGTGVVFDGAEARRGVGEGPGYEVGARRLVSTSARQEEEDVLPLCQEERCDISADSYGGQGRHSLRHKPPSYPHTPLQRCA